MISISMCMIVKNEQDILARCLDSYAQAQLTIPKKLPLTTPIKYMILNG